VRDAEQGPTSWRPAGPGQHPSADAGAPEQEAFDAPGLRWWSRGRPRSRNEEGPTSLQGGRRWKRKTGDPERIGKLVDPIASRRGRGSASRTSTGDTGGFGSEQKPRARRCWPGVQWLAEEQDKFYADDRYSMLLVFQAMDAPERTHHPPRHVGREPQGARCTPSSSRPWRSSTTTSCALPEMPPGTGRIGIFNGRTTRGARVRCRGAARAQNCRGTGDRTSGRSAWRTSRGSSATWCDRAPSC